MRFALVAFGMLGLSCFSPAAREGGAGDGGGEGDPCVGIEVRAGCAFVRCDGCYMHCGDHVTTAAAASICEAWGGRLARPTSPEARACLAPRIGQYSWVALEQDSAASSFSASWAWVDGPPFDGAWAVGEPNDGADGAEDGTENCAVLDAVGLSDLYCAFEGGQVLCEARSS